MKTLFFILLVLVSIKSVASVDECKIEIVDFNKKYSGQFDISVIKSTEGSVAMFARTTKKAGTRAQADFNNVVRTCMVAGFQHEIFMGNLGSSIATSTCVVVDYRTGGASCDKMKPTAMKITRVESSVK